jgi:hypothetical protein
MLFDFVKLTASEKIQNSLEMLFAFVGMKLFSFVRLMAQKHRRCKRALWHSHHFSFQKILM